MKPRILHRAASLFVLLPLALAALTAIVYRVGRSWLGLDPATAAWLMSLHEGRFFGQAGRLIYLALLGGALLYMAVTGVSIVLGRRGLHARAQGVRRIHRTLALWLAAPLAVIAITGVAYRWMPWALGWTEAQAGVLLRLHEGTHFGQVGRTLWTVVTAGALLALAWTGLRLRGVVGRRRVAA